MLKPSILKGKLFFSYILVFILSPFLLNAQVKKDNPINRYEINWTNEIKWDQVIDITTVSGNSISEKLSNAQNELNKKGGGVIFFPAGTYEFDDHILLKKGIVLRGSDPINKEKFNAIVPEDLPKAYIDAREPRYSLGTKFIFPKYQFSKIKHLVQSQNEAFKGIRLESAEDGEFCGVVNIEVINGHIMLGEKQVLKKNYASGKMKGHFLVYGCILTNTAVPSKSIPREWQETWQLFPDVEIAAITIFGCQNILVANNRIPEHQSSNFVMDDFLVYDNQSAWKKRGEPSRQSVTFDYENRSGIRVNWLPVLKELRIWDIHEELDQAVEEGTYEKYVTPGTLAKGIVIRNNYVYSSGHGGIKSSGDGTFIGFNIVRTRPNVVLPTRNGLFMDAHVNDIRGIEVRGWRWTIEGNDFDVHANYTPEGVKYNDGEGLMHEAWENVGVRDSKMINNVGNRYLCFWRIPVRGLEIRGNRVRTKEDFHSIFVNVQARPNSKTFIDLPCENVKIHNNITEGSGIKVIGLKGEGNEISNNYHTLIDQAIIENNAGAKVKSNRNYQIINEK